MDVAFLTMADWKSDGQATVKISVTPRKGDKIVFFVNVSDFLSQLYLEGETAQYFVLKVRHNAVQVASVRRLPELEGSDDVFEETDSCDGTAASRE